MKKGRDLTPFHGTLGITILFTLAMGVGYRPLAWLPPAIFLAICIAAAFFHGWGFYLPVISHGICCDAGNTAAVALTFDDGPDPATTPALLALLNRHGVQATFFVLGKRVRAFPELVRAISEAGHTLGNHSFSHRTGIAFKSRRHLYKEVAATQAELARLGIVPRIYRPPVGITYPGMGKVLEAFGLVTVTFNRRALDFGNRRLSGLASRILARVTPGDIIMVHDLPPYQKNVQTWLAEIDTLIRGIREKHLEIRSLAEVIGRSDIQHTDKQGSGLQS